MLVRNSSHSPGDRGRAGLRLAASLLAAALTAGALAAQATEAPRIAPSGTRQIRSSRGSRRSKSATQDKIDSRLYLGILKQRQDPRL